MEKNINFYIGNRLRWLREIRGIKQTELAVKLGVSFQQIQKYEKGINRISIEKLLKISDIFDTDIHFFLGDFHPCHSQSNSSINRIYIDKNTLEILEYYHQIKDKNICTAIKTLLSTLKN